MTPNNHYGKLLPEIAIKLKRKNPDEVIAGNFRAVPIMPLVLKHMQHYAAESNEIKVSECFLCNSKEVHCPEDSRVSCLCGRTYFKYYDVTDYDNFIERGRWNLFLNRLNFKMSSILNKLKSK